MQNIEKTNESGARMLFRYGTGSKKCVEYESVHAFDGFNTYWSTLCLFKFAGSHKIRSLFIYGIHYINEFVAAEYRCHSQFVIKGFEPLKMLG